MDEGTCFTLSAKKTDQSKWERFISLIMIDKPIQSYGTRNGSYFVQFKDPVSRDWVKKTYDSA